MRAHRTASWRYLGLAWLLPSAIGVSLAGQPQDNREPASRAAVVLTWNQTQREAGFAGMETIFQTRTVRAGDRPHPLPDGKPLPFAPGGPRADEFNRFVNGQKSPACSCSTMAPSASSATR